MYMYNGKLHLSLLKFSMNSWMLSSNESRSWSLTVIVVPLSLKLEFYQTNFGEIATFNVRSLYVWHRPHEMYVLRRGLFLLFSVSFYYNRFRRLKLTKEINLNLFNKPINILISELLGIRMDSFLMVKHEVFFIESWFHFFHENNNVSHRPIMSYCGSADWCFFWWSRCWSYLSMPIRVTVLYFQRFSVRTTQFHDEFRSPLGNDIMPLFLCPSRKIET